VNRTKREINQLLTIRRETGTWLGGCRARYWSRRWQNRALGLISLFDRNRPLEELQHNRRCRTYRVGDSRRLGGPPQIGFREDLAGHEQCSGTSAVPAIALAVMMENSYPVRLRNLGSSFRLTRTSSAGGFQFLNCEAFCAWRSARRTNTAELSQRECIELESSPIISGATQDIMPFGHHGKADTLKSEASLARDASRMVGHPEINRLFPDTP